MAFTSSATAVSANSNCSWRDEKGAESVGFLSTAAFSSLRCSAERNGSRKERKATCVPRKERTDGLYGETLRSGRLGFLAHLRSRRGPRPVPCDCSGTAECPALRPRQTQTLAAPSPRPHAGCRGATRPPLGKAEVVSSLSWPST